MIHDGLWDVYHQKPMGTCGDACASQYGFSHQEQDDFAVRSFTRARKAIADGIFRDEIVPVEVDARGENDAGHRRRRAGEVRRGEAAGLKPAFGAEGTITAGNASSISDGAAALLVASRGECERPEDSIHRPDRRRRDVQPGARVVHHGAGRRHSQAARPRRLGRRPGRSLRDQRGVRRGRDGGRARTVDIPPEKAQYPWAAPWRSGTRSAVAGRGSW